MTEPAGPQLGLEPPGPPRTCSQTYPGRPGQVAAARAFVAAAVHGCPAADDVVLMVGEIAANAVLHSRSGQPGGRFTVRVEACPGRWVQVLVDDAGGPQPPRLRGITRDRSCAAASNGGVSAGPARSGRAMAEPGGAGDASADPDAANPGGRGLQIVDALADAWGVAGNVTGRTVWFRAGWGAP